MYDDSWYEATGRYWDLIYPREEFKTAFSKSVRTIQRRLGKKEGLRILDLCCGTGRTLSAFTDDPRGIFYGIDANNKMLKKARNHLTRASFIRKDVLILNRRDLPAQDFDLVLMGGSSIQHFSEGERARILKLVHVLLRPGGLFIFDTQKLQSTNARYGASLSRMVGW